MDYIIKNSGFSLEEILQKRNFAVETFKVEYSEFLADKKSKEVNSFTFLMTPDDKIPDLGFEFFALIYFM